MESYNALQNNNIIDDKVKILRELFCGRTDVVPKYWEYMIDSEKKSGYSPMCANRKDEEKCKKKSENQNCKTCAHKKYIHLTDNHLRDHIKGVNRYGVYPLLDDNTCHFIAADFDNHHDGGMRDPYADMKKFVEVSSGHDVECYVERSKSGNGFHVYTFFETPVQAWKARAMCNALLDDAQVNEDVLVIENVHGVEKKTFESFDRLFPAQNEVSVENPYGNLIGLPLHGKSILDDCTLFLDPETQWTKPYSDQVEALRKAVKMTDEQVDQFLSDWGISLAKPVQSIVKIAYSNEQLDALMQCNFLKHTYENQKDIEEPLWLAMLSNVSRVPSGAIHLCHEFSRNYPGYSYAETEKKILQAIDGSKPQTCDYIRSLGYKCTKNCGVKSPVGLLSRKAPKPNTVEMSNTSSQSVLLRDYLPDIPTKSNLILPQGYSYENGLLVTRVVKGRGELRTEIVANEPVIITGMLKEVGTKNESVEIAAYHNNQWISEIVPRGVIANQKEIISLANIGYPGDKYKCEIIGRLSSLFRACKSFDITD